MKKFGLLLLILMALVAHTFQPPTKPLMPKASRPYQEPIMPYYTPAVFNSLASGKQHMPMLIIFDQLNDEKEDANNVSLSSLLARAIFAPATPILTTGSVLKNLLVRTRTYPPNHLHSQQMIRVFN